MQLLAILISLYILASNYISYSFKDMVQVRSGPPFFPAQLDGCRLVLGKNVCDLIMTGDYLAHDLYYRWAKYLPVMTMTCIHSH